MRMRSHSSSEMMEAERTQLLDCNASSPNVWPSTETNTRYIQLTLSQILLSTMPYSTHSSVPLNDPVSSDSLPSGTPCVAAAWRHHHRHYFRPGHRLPSHLGRVLLSPWWKLYREEWCRSFNEKQTIKKISVNQRVFCSARNNRALNLKTNIQYNVWVLCFVVYILTTARNKVAGACECKTNTSHIRRENINIDDYYMSYHWCSLKRN